MTHILVGGGTGFVGRHLVKCLKDSGAKVKVITRKPGSNTDQISWQTVKEEGLPKDTNAVVNLAGRNILDVLPWTASYKKEVYESRIESNKILADAINKAKNPVKAFVTVSGVGYYESSDTIEYTEEWQQTGDTSDYLMNLARDWEKASQIDEQLAPDTRRVIIRAGVVLGRDGGIIKNMYPQFSLGLGAKIGSGKQWFPWIHADDLANMFKFAIINDHVTGIINGVAPNHITNQEFTTAFAKALNRPTFIGMPEFAVKMMFGNERAPILLKGPKVKSRAALLGFRYDYADLDKALAQILSNG